MTSTPVCFRNAEVAPGNVIDVRVERGHIAAMGRADVRPGDQVIDARGGALLPGLSDHHVHLMSFAASLDSVSCGPPEVTNEKTLIRVLRQANSGGWIRGFRYHESVAGDIDRAWLDRCVPDSPARIQHRSGRLWILNSAALDLLGEPAPADGRLFDRDADLGRAIGRELPRLDEASRLLASYGVTGVTDMTPDNTDETVALLGDLRARGAIKQHLRIAGTLDAATTDLTKIHLHESALPRYQQLCRIVSTSHGRNRPVAIHCVTETELVFALAALRETTVHPGDRIEHASVTPPALLVQIRELGLTVVTQPLFVTERGDVYLKDIPAAEHPWLYRSASFLDAGIRTAAGSDAPFGGPDPWQAMRAAVTRRTAAGHRLGTSERLTPEQALSLFTGSLDDPAKPKPLTPGAPADLCLLAVPWSRARQALSSEHVVATCCAGELVHNRVDQTPAQSNI